MLWYLSFAGEGGFRGACVVDGEDIVGAVKEAHRLGINPGGQVLGIVVPLEEMERLPAGKLLTYADLQEAAGPLVTGAELELAMGRGAPVEEVPDAGRRRV